MRDAKEVDNFLWQMDKYDTLKFSLCHCQVNSGCCNTLDSIPENQFILYLYSFNIKLKQYGGCKTELKRNKQVTHLSCFFRLLRCWPRVTSSGVRACEPNNYSSSI